jgi:hypothetical protein
MVAKVSAALIKFEGTILIKQIIHPETKPGKCPVFKSKVEYFEI